MGTATEVLIEARRLIAEKGWTKHDYAEVNGKSVSWLDSEADCFCMSGALYCALSAKSDDDNHPAFKLLSQAISDEGGKARGIPFWNDYVAKSKEQVLAAFDRAIELSKQPAA